MKAIVIAGTSSGVGKTIVALGLMGALVNRGYLFKLVYARQESDQRN